MVKIHKEEDILKPTDQFSISAVFALLRLDKQYGTLLVLLPALWTLLIASEGRPDPVLLIIIISGAFLMRSAGCAINDIADRNFDPHVERTRNRPLASGAISFSRATVIFFSTVLFAALLTLYLNPLAIMLSTGCLFFVIIYPFTKRFLSIPQFFLGIAFGWGSLIVWAAVREEISLIPILIFFATVTWAVAYDTIYAMMDIEDDMRVGVKSTAILFGRYVKEAVALFFGITVILVVATGIIAGMGLPYYLAVFAASILFVGQVRQTAKNMGRDAAFEAFKSNVRAGFIILAGIVLDFMMDKV